MLLDTISDAIKSDLEILEAIGEQVGAMIEKLMSTGVIEKTLRRWLVGHADLPEDDDAQNCLMAMAADLEMFTPSASGHTMVDRHVKTAAAATSRERQALHALAAAQFRLVSIVDREEQELVRLTDLVTRETILLLDERISPLAAGVSTAMRLCPLESGRQVLTSPLFAMNEAMLSEAMSFVRHGRPLGSGHRCAASLYRNVARRGFHAIPQSVGQLDEGTIADLMGKLEDSLSPIQHLAIRWEDGDDADPELATEARSLASADNLIDALGSFALAAHDRAPDVLRLAFEQIAALQVETIAARTRAGVHGAAQLLDQVAIAVADHIAQGRMYVGARELLERLRQRSGFAGTKKPVADASPQAADGP